MAAITAGAARQREAASAQGERLNAAVWLVDRLIENGHGGRTAIRSGGRDLTYSDVADLVAAVTRALRAGGCRPEERVLLCMVDGPELVAAFLGAMRAGCVPVPVSTMATGPELGFLAEDSRARIAVVSGDFGANASTMAAGRHALTGVVAHGDPGQISLPQGVPLQTWPEWLASGDGQSDEPEDMHRDSPAFWLYTSGTTGQPKGAIHRHADLPATALTYATAVLDVRPDDRCYSVAKVFFAYGLGNSLTFPFAVGACAILDAARPTPSGVAAAVRSESPTLFFAGPSFYSALLAADLPADTFASVRLAVSAGESLPEPVFTRFRDRFGVEILDGIGSTEALHIFISNRPGKIIPGASGTVVPGYEAKVVDDRGEQVAAGETGHLMVKGDSAATGYWCRTAVSRRTFVGEWLRTGDMYTCDEQGVYRFRGRSDDMFKAGGIWVAPVEVESTLLDYEGVLEAAVIPEADSDGLERPVAFVVSRPDAVVDVASLMAFCRSRLAPHKRPRRIVLCAQLPRTATGKVQRFRLRG